MIDHNEAERFAWRIRDIGQEITREAYNMALAVNRDAGANDLRRRLRVIINHVMAVDKATYQFEATLGDRQPVDQRENTHEPLP